MKNNLIRIISLSLAAIMLCAVIVSCSKPGSQSDTTAGNTGDVTDGKYHADVPAKNYDGANFTIMCRDPEMGWGEMAIVSDDQAVTVLEDATYNRNCRIEQDYGIKFKFYTFTDTNQSGDLFYQTLFNNTQSYDDIADICIPGAIDAATLASTGIFLNLDGGVPYVNLNNPWWQKMLNDSLKIMNKQYFAINDSLLNDKQDTYAMFFNKSLFDDRNIEYPYPLVDSGEWTIDKFMSMIKDQGQDLNSNDAPDYEDAFGFVGFIYDTFFVGSGVTGAYLDKESGEPRLTPYSEKTEDIYSKIYQIAKGSLYDTYSVGQEPLYDNSIDGTFLKAFDTKSLFTCGPLGFYFSIIQKMTSDVGVLPCPKYDEQQTSYYHRAGYNGATAVTVLASVGDKERAGIILEAFGAESKNYISPAYYETLLTNRYAQDEDSKRMISLIIDTEMFDLDQLFRWGAILETMQGYLGQGQKTVSTLFGRSIQRAQTKLDQTISEYSKLK